MNEHSDEIISFGQFMCGWCADTHKANLFAIYGVTSVPKDIWIELGYVVLLYKKYDTFLSHDEMFHLTALGIEQYELYLSWLSL